MIGTFARFDIVNFATPVRRVAPALLLVVATAVATPLPVFAIGTAAIVMSLLAANPFAADERSHLDTLYATLPINRRNVVLGRYLALVLAYLAAALIATIAAIIITLGGGHSVDVLAFAAANVAAFLVFAVSVAVQLPFFFSVGATRARPMIFIPAVVFGGGAALASQTGLLSRIDFATAISANLGIVSAAVVVIAVAALLGSIAISTVRYNRRAL
ncbi:MAG: ABC-2 transporter permease [Pseudolysinimonas sp.]|uniref:ABC-2 transporter permease n=1 Tax=Pseudolysinimonas sp. TaxID=2680009 RepID=UPI003267C3FC